MRPVKKLIKFCRPCSMNKRKKIKEKIKHEDEYIWWGRMDDESVLLVCCC